MALFLMLLKLISYRHLLLINLPAAKTIRKSTICLCLLVLYFRYPVLWSDINMQNIQARREEVKNRGVLGIHEHFSPMNNAAMGQKGHLWMDTNLAIQ